MLYAACPRCKALQPAQVVGKLVHPSLVPFWPDRVVGTIYGCLTCRLAYSVIAGRVAAVGHREQGSGDTPEAGRNGASPSQQFPAREELARSAQNRIHDSDANW